ncbi:ABC transporter permease [Promicromonospora aerolata]|uniref:ABC transporter permease n=1 Tax=Promicromonospora aerolata TaxID=195749 RepID=A0ABW4VD77_9MICO
MDRDSARLSRRGTTGSAPLLWAVAVAVPLGFLGTFFAWPVIALVVRGFLPDGMLDLTGFTEVLLRPRTWQLVRFTLTQAVLGTAFSVLLGLPLAYLLYRRSFPGRSLVRGLVTVPFVLPAVVVGVAFRTLFAPGGTLGFLGLEESLAGIVVALVFFNVSVVVRTVGGLWERLDPRTEQAAASLGAGPVRVFRTVTLPSLAPAIVSAASVVFLFCATAFGVVLVLGGVRYGTIETEIWIRTTQFLDLRSASVLSIMQLVVISGALALSARARRRREAALRLVSARGSARRLSWRSPQDVTMALVGAAIVVGLLVLPLAGLVARSFREPDGSWGPGNYVALGTTGERNALVVTVWEATATSLRIALTATLISLVVGGLVALVVSRRPRSPGARRAVGTLDGLFMLPLGVSAVTVGFGFLITMDQPVLGVDLRTSGLLVPVAQAVVAVPLVVRTVLPVLRAIDPRLREVAAVLGSGPGRVLRTVDLPIALRSVGLATGFAFAVSLGEFGATSFLARPDGATLPVVIYRLIGRPGAENYGMALAASVVLAVLTATVMMVAEQLRDERAGGEF